MAFKRFISVALAGLLMLSSVNTGSLKAYAASDENESIADELIMEAAEDLGENELMDEAGTEAAQKEPAFDDTAHVEDNAAYAEGDAAFAEDDEAFTEDDAVSAEDTEEETKASEDTDDGIVEVVFDAGGGVFDNQETTVTFRVSKGTLLSEIQAEPVKEGFEFEGWFLDAKFTKAADPKEFVLTENAVLFAKWQETATDDEESILMAAESGLYLDANGGQFPDGTGTYYYEYFEPSWSTDLDYARMRPTRDGEVFVGWYKEKDCVTRLSTDDDPYVLKSPSGLSANATIYAKYTTDFSTVTFVYGSGKDGDKGYYWDETNKERVNTISINVLNGKTIGSAGAEIYYGFYNYNNIRNADPGYSFSESWYEDEARNTEAISTYEIYNRKITAPLTIYAGFVEDRKVITFHSGESTAYFTTEVYDRSEKYEKLSESAYTMPLTQSGDYRIYTGNFLSTDWVYNTDPSKDIEGFYLSENFDPLTRLELNSNGYITVPRNEDDVWIKWASTKPVITFVANGGEEGYIWHKDPHTGEYSKKDQVEFALEAGTYKTYNVGELKSSNPRWKFLGWSEYENATSADERFGYYKSGSSYYTQVNPELPENITLYGVWDKNYYWIVTFKAGDGGYFEIKADDGTIERTNEYIGTINAMSEGSSTSYTPLIPKIDDPKLDFSEWEKEDGTTTGRSYVWVDRDNMVFTAVYDNIYTVTLHADDDTRIHGGYYTDDNGNKVAKKEIVTTQKAGTRVTDPSTDKNYTFGGWYENPEFTIRANVNYSYYYPDKDIHLYARWLKICSVTFDAGTQGTIDVNSSQTYVMEKTEGEKICKNSDYSLPVAVPNNDDTLFVAWVIKQDGGTEVRYKNSEVRDYEVSGDVTFTATYNEAVDVKFVADGGFVNKDTTVTEVNVRVPKGESIGTRVPTPRDIDGQTPKVFSGWLDKPESGGGKEITNLYDLKPETPTVLYAGYADCNVVTFHANNTDAKAVFDNGADTFKVLVPKGKAFEYTWEGTNWKTQAAPEISYDATYTAKVLLRSNAGAGNLGWATNNGGTGDIYYLNDGYSYVVEDDGSKFYFEDNGFVPTGNTDFYGVWVPEVEATFTLVADGEKGKTFDEAKVNNNEGWTLSGDKMSVTYKVPSGIRFGDFYGPDTSDVSNPPENKYLDWGYDSDGKAIPSDKKITTKTTITNKWVKEDTYTPEEEKTVTLHAGKGYFGSKGYEYAVDTEGYVVGETRWIGNIPVIDDPDEAFIGYSTTPDGTTADYGTQKFDLGWSVTYTSEVSDLYAVYGPTATLNLDANGGFFAGSSSSQAEYSEEERDKTSISIKPSIATSAGATITLDGYTSKLKHDGNKVFDGWTLKADGTQPLELSATNMNSMVFTASLAEPVKAYAKWAEVTDDDVPATLTLNAGDQKLKIGDVKDLAEVLSSKPESFKDTHNVNWRAGTVYDDSSSSSSKSSTAVVSISNNGILTAVSEGKAKVWAESNGRRSNEITVTVTDSSTPAPTEITVDTGKRTIEEGESIEVTATVTPATEAGNLEWKSSNTKAATVSYEGAKATITGVVEGKTTVSVQVKGESGTKKQFDVEVVKHVDPIRIEGEATVNLTAKKGNIAEFVATLNEANKGKNVVWESSDPEVLSVTAKSEDGTKVVVEVVKDLPVKKTVSVTARIEGTDNTATVDVLLNPQKSAEAPKANPSPKNEEDPCEVLKKELIELSTGTTDASIFYTTDGTDPKVKEDENGKPIPASETVKEYQDAIRIAEIEEKDIIDGVVTVKAIAVKKGLNPSETATFKYRIKKDDWGDLAKDSSILKKAKEWFNNDSNNVPQDVWFVQQAQDEIKRLDGEKPETVTKTYTGSKITFNQEVVVYHGTRQLIENRDYTITYKNNINVAGPENAKAPTFTVKGKGQYNSVKDFRFEITPESIKEALLASEKNIVVIAGKNVKLGNTKPVVTYNGKKLTEGKDYTLEYRKVEGGKETVIEVPAKEILSEENLGEAGKALYTIAVKGEGNFSGTHPEETNVEVIRKEKNIVQASKLKVVDAKGKAVAVEYTGEPLNLEKMFDNSNEETAQDASAFVKNGKKTLIYGKDYEVEAASGSDLTSAGKQQIVIKGKAKSDAELDEEGAVLYVGEKTVAIDIKPKAAINKAKVAGLKTTVEYIGRNFTNDDLNKNGELFNTADKNLESGWEKVTLYTMSGKSRKALVEGQDYDVEAFDTGIVGKFTIVFRGKNGCTGTLKKTVTVKAANLKRKKLKVKPWKVKYVKTGAKPAADVSIVNDNGTEVTLKQGIDYTVTYKNNTKVFNIEGKTEKELKNAPAVIVKGIGNYTGTGESQPFTIESGDPEQITAFVKDVAYNKNKSGKSGYFLAAPKLMDNGKAVTTGKGKDVESVDKKAIKYTYFVDTILEDGKTKKSAGTEVGARDKIPAGTIIAVEVPVTITSKSPYYNAEGSDPIKTTITGTYRVIGADISKAKITIKDPGKLVVNNGEAVRLTKADITVKIGNGELTAADYEIVSCTNNTGVGSMTITIAGKGNYGRTKSQSFKIKAKSMN